LGDAGEGETAVALLRESQRRRPDDFWLNEGLAGILHSSRPERREEAVGFARVAVALRPKIANAHYNLGVLLYGQGKAAEAEKEFREALRIKPDFPDAHYNLGLLLAHQSQAAEAEAEYREALRLRPDSPEAHFDLAVLLKGQGRAAEAVGEARRAGDLLGPTDPRRGAADGLVRECERLAERQPLLPAVLGGAAEPADAAAALDFAALCTAARPAAARLFAAAFEADPAAADLGAESRYAAACAAALAGCGRGEDAAALTDGDRYRLRLQALGWLREELTAWRKQAAGPDAAGRAAARMALRHWREDADLAGVRDAAGLAELPEEEQAEWKKLWADVDAALKEARGPG
jgi:tetratricopeptide (TPR) repeat protein